MAQGQAPDLSSGWGEACDPMPLLLLTTTWSGTSARYMHIRHTQPAHVPTYERICLINRQRLLAGRPVAS